MDELSDPTITQGYCERCGMPVRSDTFNVRSNYAQTVEKTSEGMMRLGMPLPDTVEFAEHRATRSGWRHEISPHYGRWDTNPHDDGDEYVVFPADNRTHEQDFERQKRNFETNQLDKLGRQFRGN